MSAAMDHHESEWLGQVRPKSWVNPKPSGRYNLVVIGAGTAGLVTAAGAAGLGAKVALVEKHLMGGDCLNFGCVPSKALLRCARAVADARAAAGYGARVDGPVGVDFGAVMERLRGLRARISHHDSAERFRGLGVDVYLGNARFKDGATVEVDGTQLKFARAVVATGARALVPEIAGLVEAGFLTNETVFSIRELPKRLAVIGGGPIGCELAQAFARLGSEVTLFHRHPTVLDREDTGASRLVEAALRPDGVTLELSTRIDSVVRAGVVRTLRYQAGNSAKTVEVDAVLVAAGRLPNVANLGLEAAGVAYDHRKGVVVDDRLRTTHPRIYACGDVCFRHRFTHAADATARIVIQNALFHGRKRASDLVVPRCTYTDPEVAQVGMTEAEAAREGVEVEAVLRPLADVDRARLDGEEDGFVKVLVAKGTDRMVGATVVARHAGEMIGELCLAMSQGIGLGKLASVILPYPTQSEAIKHCGDAWNRRRLTPAVKAIFERWLRWTR